MNRYMETFRRHKVGLVLPLIIALVMSTWYATSRPHKYQAGITLWFDTQAPAASSLTNPGNTTPAAQGMAVLQEFLGTQQFLLNVGHQSSLAAFVANYHPTKSGPTALISKLLHHGSSSSSAKPTAEQIDAGILGTLGKAFSVVTTGPQLVRVTMTSANPSYMASALNAVATQYIASIGQELNSRNAASSNYYSSQLSQAQAQLTTANNALTTYQQSHPGALSTTDPKYAALISAVAGAQANYTTVKNGLEQSTISVQTAEAASAFHVVDAPTGIAELSNKKHIIFTVVAGLLAGLVVSLLAMSALMSLDKTARRQEDIEGVGGMEVVATIRQLPRQMRIPGLSRGTKSS